MFLRNLKFSLFLVFTFICLSYSHPAIGSEQQTKRRFTVADDIGLALFGEEEKEQAVQVSPDGAYFAVDTERGRLDLNRVEGSLRFYRSQDVENFLAHSASSQPPSPIWVVNRSTYKEGPIINDWRWLADSSGVAFLERTDGGNQRLVLADLQKKTIEPLTSTTETVRTFDIRDRQHYVYTVTDQAPNEKLQSELQAPVVVGTGREFYELVFPDDPAVISWLSVNRNYLWAVIGGRRFEVKNNGAPLVLFSWRGDLALSPDGGSLVTTLPVPEVPVSWETLYPPPFASYPKRIRIGRVGSGDVPVNQYVQINLETGSVQALTHAPASYEGGWWAGGRPSWSSDGQEILLPGTFLSSKDNAPSRPCVAVVDLSSNTRTCVEILKRRTETGVEEGYHLVQGARFAGGDKHRVMVIFSNPQGLSLGTTEYQHMVDGAWQVTGQSSGAPKVEHNGLEVTTKEGLNEPPLLVATNKQASRVIWDPNPQLKNIDLGLASVYKWKDKEGRDWNGGLFKPGNYKMGQRYPLVIQTHGFYESKFIPSGVFPAAFAARELAAEGIVVLQVGGGGCLAINPQEGLCNAGGYESGAKQLVSEGVVDPERIGIIGFSRTCFHVMEMLTTGSFQLKAASVTDGVMENYLQYMMFSNAYRESDLIIGAKPFGEGLQQWLKRSPGFNLDKITSPLLVIGEGPVSLLSMWEPYAGLRFLQKPVDLMMLNTREHVLTNPAVRMASQGGSVDWFRFWLQNYEDPDPAKVELYKRWRELRKLQEANDRSSTAPQAASN